MAPKKRVCLDNQEKASSRSIVAESAVHSPSSEPADHSHRQTMLAALTVATGARLPPGQPAPAQVVRAQASVCAYCNQTEGCHDQSYSAMRLDFTEHPTQPGKPDVCGPCAQVLRRNPFASFVKPNNEEWERRGKYSFMKCRCYYIELKCAFDVLGASSSFSAGYIDVLTSEFADDFPSMGPMGVFPGVSPP